MDHELFRIVETDHEAVKDILDRLEQSAPGGERDTLLGHLFRELIPHLKAEEAVFYPALQGEVESRKNALVAVEEHRVIESALRDIESPPLDEDLWEARVSVFRDIFIRHIEDEESTLFEDAREVLSDEEMDDIAARFGNEKEAVVRSGKAERRKAA
jgi:hemerythrin-like domain-containing protein